MCRNCVGTEFSKHDMYKRVCVCVCQTVNGEKHPTDNTLLKALWAYCKALWVKQTIVTLQLIGGLQLAPIHAPRGQSVRYLRTRTKVNRAKIDDRCFSHPSIYTFRLHTTKDAIHTQLHTCTRASTSRRKRQTV